LSEPVTKACRSKMSDSKKWVWHVRCPCTQWYFTILGLGESTICPTCGENVDDFNVIGWDVIYDGEIGLTDEVFDD